VLSSHHLDDPAVFRLVRDEDTMAQAADCQEAVTDLAV